MSADKLWNPQHKAFIGENNPMNSTGTTEKPLVLTSSTSAEAVLDWMHSLPRDRSMFEMMVDRLEAWVKICQVPGPPQRYPVIQGLQYIVITVETTSRQLIEWLLQLPRWEEGWRLGVMALNNWARAHKTLIAN